MNIKEFSKLLENKTIKEIAGYDPDGIDLRFTREEQKDGSITIGDYDNDTQGQLTIKFTDGSIATVWASEWGGIEFKSGAK